MAYDRADWHYGGDYPDGLPPENGATHIGMYLGWAIKRGLAGEFHIENSHNALDAVRSGRLSGRDFLLEQCDEKFWEEDLNDEGNRFKAAYYDAHYFDDYMECLDSDDAKSVYHYNNSPENQALVEALLDRRFAAWKQEQRAGTASPRPSKSSPRQTARKKPWWRFW